MLTVQRTLALLDSLGETKRGDYYLYVHIPVESSFYTSRGHIAKFGMTFATQDDLDKAIEVLKQHLPDHQEERLGDHGKKFSAPLIKKS